MAIPAFEGRWTRTGAYAAEFTPEEMEAIRQAEGRYGHQRDVHAPVAIVSLVELGVELLRAVPDADHAIANGIRRFGERWAEQRRRARAEREMRRRRERGRRIEIRFPEVRTESTPRFLRILIAYMALVLALGMHKQVGQLSNEALIYFSQPRAQDTSEEPQAHEEPTAYYRTPLVPDSWPTVPSVSEIEAGFRGLPLRQLPMPLGNTFEAEPPEAVSGNSPELTDNAKWESDDGEPPILRRKASSEPAWPTTRAQVQPQSETHVLPQQLPLISRHPTARVVEDDEEREYTEARRRRMPKKPSRLRRVFGAIGRGYVEITNLPFDLLDLEP